MNEKFNVKGNNVYKHNITLNKNINIIYNYYLVLIIGLPLCQKFIFLILNRIYLHYNTMCVNWLMRLQNYVAFSYFTFISFDK